MENTMAEPIRTSAPHFGISASALRFLGVILFLVALRSDARALPTDGAPSNTAQVCASFGNEFDASTDVRAFKEYGAAVAQLLQQQDFKKLDCIADAARSNKTTFAGGMPHLHVFYRGTSTIDGHTTEEDWTDRLARLQRWVSANPKSITARVALAKAYVNYAWNARGDGLSNTVSGSGWRLFAQRLAKAKTILDEASALPSKCPEWYVTMQRIAQGQGWDLDQFTALFEQARAFDPAYYYNYVVLANYLLPKWSGNDGAASTFAEENADRMGGTDGDTLYFQIGAELVCACDEQREFSRMSWPRLQKGYAELEKKYGSSMVNLNSLALMATSYNDSEVGDATFKRIGQQWDKDTWITEDYFNQNKAGAAARLANWRVAQARAHVFVEEAASNLQSPKGQQYRLAVEQAFAPFMQQCEKDAGKVEEKFEMMLKMGPDGGVDDLFTPHPHQTPLANCLVTNLWQSHVKHETPFPPPPHPDYWLTLDLDPAAPIAAK
jgi:hypothetical protein